LDATSGYQCTAVDEFASELAVRENKMVTWKQKIVPHLWFDKEAKEAAEFYAPIFDGSCIKI
jgi:hypothetical protein